MSNASEVPPFDVVSALYSAAQDAARATNQTSEISACARVIMPVGKPAEMLYSVTGNTATINGGFECGTGPTVAAALAEFLSRLPSAAARREHRLAALRAEAALIGAEVITK